MRDLASCVDLNISTAALGGADGSAVFTDIDRLDADALTLGIAVPADASATALIFYDLLLEHSDDGTTYVACTANDLISSTGAALTVTAGVIGDEAYVFDNGTNGVDIRTAGTSVHLGYRGEKRYVQLTIRETGAATGGTAVLAVLKGHLRYQPPA